MRKLFGTDGVRGLVNEELTAELAVKLARAAVQVQPAGPKPYPRFLIARDTRISGSFLEAAVIAGLCSAGADAIVGGIMPTPAAAHLIRAMGLDGGIVISASHNTYQYNGLKFFGPGGDKLSDAQEAEIESSIGQPPGAAEADRRVGRALLRPELASRYADHVAGSVSGRLNGLQVVVDCGHGALSNIAPAVLGEMGADVLSINCSPNGKNINVGGAVRPRQLARTVREHGAAAGLAFDGDGDRVALVDEQGGLVDGDHILAMWANDLAASGRLANNLVVGTLITNGGLEAFLKSLGCSMLRTPVGDRYVSAEMQRAGAVLGGETCGHVIFAPHLPSADALLAGATMLELMARTGQPLSSLAAVMTKRPQVSCNIPVTSSDGYHSDPVVGRVLAEAREALSGRGWLVVRPSGTEPLIRITAESNDDHEARDIAERVAGVIQNRLALNAPSPGDPSA